jgi:hypothetical protein
MKKVIVLCSALVFGLCSESAAYLVDIDGDATKFEKETITPQLSLVAVQERMNRLNEASAEEGQKMFRRLYNEWFSNDRKWTRQGSSSTINNIQGYCESRELNNFKGVLKYIEEKIDEATATSSTEVEDAKSAIEVQNNTTKATKDGTIEGAVLNLEVQNDTTTATKEKTIEAAVLNLEVQNDTTKETRSETVRTTMLAEELPIDTSDTRKKNKKIQRDLLEQATDTMEGTLYAESPDITTTLPAFELTSLADIFGEAGVDVDEDFIVSLKRAWSMKALDMSINEVNKRVDTKNGDKDTYGNQQVIKTYQSVDPNIFSNSDIATFLLDHFAKTDTGSNKKIPDSDPEENTVWNLSSEGHPIIRDLLKYGRNEIKLMDGEEDTDVSKDIRDSLIRIFDVKYEGDDDDVKYEKLTDLKIEKNGKEFKTFKNMKFHLNLVARMLQEIEKEKDETCAQTPTPSDDKKVYEVDGIVFHAFRQYMTQAFREAISLIKVSEEISKNSSETDPTPDPEP